MAVANEFDPEICPTYRKNHTHTILIEGDVRKVVEGDLPNGVVGLVGDPLLLIRISPFVFNHSKN